LKAKARSQERGDHHLARKNGLNKFLLPRVDNKKL